MFKKTLSSTIIVCFFLTTLGPYPAAHADSVLNLPAPGTMVSVSSNFEPALIRGLTVHQDNPFLFDFIVDPGQSKLSKQALKDESERMIKYFFAALTIPDKDIWVNLSPYEKDRMVPVSLGQTAMGRDLLAQDYMLKQLTASLIYPQKALGKTFWEKVYTKAKEMYGTTQIPVNTFNKVWIVPQKAGVYEHGQTAFIVNGHLKVMLEEDYLALSKNECRGGSCIRPITGPTQGRPLRNDVNALGSQIVRSIILPEIEKEINEGKNFATLRQIFYAQVLAVWFKRNLKQALLNQVYANKGTVKGIDQNDSATNEAIYHQYLSAYKKGVFNYIKEDIDPVTQETLPRKYFSGGYGDSALLSIEPADLSLEDKASISKDVDFAVVAARPKDAAALAISNPNGQSRKRLNTELKKLKLDLKTHQDELKQLRLKRAEKLKGIVEIKSQIALKKNEIRQQVKAKKTVQGLGSDKAMMAPADNDVVVKGSDIQNTLRKIIGPMIKESPAVKTVEIYFYPEKNSTIPAYRKLTNFENQLVKLMNTMPSFSSVDGFDGSGDYQIKVRSGMGDSVSISIVPNDAAMTSGNSAITGNELKELNNSLKSPLPLRFIRHNYMRNEIAILIKPYLGQKQLSLQDIRSLWMAFNKTFPGFGTTKTMPPEVEQSFPVLAEVRSRIVNILNDVRLNEAGLSGDKNKFWTFTDDPWNETNTYIVYSFEQGVTTKTEYTGGFASDSRKSISESPGRKELDEAIEKFKEGHPLVPIRIDSAMAAEGPTYAQRLIDTALEWFSRQKVKNSKNETVEVWIEPDRNRNLQSREIPHIRPFTAKEVPGLYIFVPDQNLESPQKFAAFVNTVLSGYNWKGYEQLLVELNKVDAAMKAKKETYPQRLMAAAEKWLSVQTVWNNRNQFFDVLIRIGDPKESGEGFYESRSTKRIVPYIFIYVQRESLKSPKELADSVNSVLSTYGWEGYDQLLERLNSVDKAMTIGQEKPDEPFGFLDKAPTPERLLKNTLTLKDIKNILWWRLHAISKKADETLKKITENFVPKQVVNGLATDKNQSIVENLIYMEYLYRVVSNLPIEYTTFFKEIKTSAAEAEKELLNKLGPSKEFEDLPIETRALKPYELVVIQNEDNEFQIFSGEEFPKGMPSELKPRIITTDKAMVGRYDDESLEIQDIISKDIRPKKGQPIPKNRYRGEKKGWNFATVNTLERTNKDVVDDQGGTTLMWAVFRNDIDEVKKLLKQGANVDAKDDHGNTAMSLAKKFSHWDIVEILKEHIANNADKSLAINGGIDLSQQDAALHVEKDANGGVKVNVDPALITRVLREGMPEVVPVIINMQPADIRSLFGAGDSV